MRYTHDVGRRDVFRDWLRKSLAELDFYQRRGDRYLISEFARYANDMGARVEEVSLGRYLREESPVLPTPENCRELARALGKQPAEALMYAGYLLPEDFLKGSLETLDYEGLRRLRAQIWDATFLPTVIREDLLQDIDDEITAFTEATTGKQRNSGAPPVAGTAPL